MESERKVAGLWCSEVLACLSEYTDGELGADKAKQIDDHLSGCDWCLRFGTQFSAVMRAVVSQLAAPEPLNPAVSARLYARLRKGASSL